MATAPRGRIAALCALVLVAEIAVAVGALAAHGAGSTATQRVGRGADPSSASGRPAPDTRSPALTWLAAQLPRSAAVLADDTVRAQLAARGFRAVGRPAQPSYTVSTPALRRLAGRQPALAAALRAAVPIAVFTVAGGLLVVGQVVRVGAPTVARHRADDAHLRRDAGRALAANPTCTATPAARAALAAGDLDLRAATALALLAANGRVELTSVTARAPETRAGLPARTIIVRATPEAAQRALLAGLTGAYRPQRWVRLTDGSYRMTWPIRADPDDTRR